MIVDNHVEEVTNMDVDVVKEKVTKLQMKIEIKIFKGVVEEEEVTIGDTMKEKMIKLK